MQGFYENHRDEMAHAYAWIARDDHFAPHFHNSVELSYVLEGELVATLDGVEWRAGPGTMLIISSYVVHSYETPAASRSIVAIIPIAEVPSVRPLLAKQAFARPVCIDDARGTLRTLMELLAARPEASPLTRKGLCYALLGLLIERVGLAPARPSSRAAFIRDVLAYLEQHHAEPLTAGGVAAHFGYSRSRFSHIFQAQLGFALMETIATIRCRHAAQLLRETDLPVAQVALAVGFESLRTFYRTFKKQYGMTPQRHRAAAQPPVGPGGPGIVAREQGQDIASGE